MTLFLLCYLCDVEGLHRTVAPGRKLCPEHQAEWDAVVADLLPGTPPPPE